MKYEGTCCGDDFVDENVDTTIHCGGHENIFFC